MVYLQLQVRLRWSDERPENGIPIQDAPSVDSAMLIMAAHSAQRFKESVSVGNDSWYDSMAWCKIPDPAPPAYAAHGFTAPMPWKSGFPVLNNVQSQCHWQARTTALETSNAPNISIPPMQKESIAPYANQRHDLAHCTTRTGDGNNHMRHHCEDNKDGQPCRFGRPCGVLLTDLTEDGLNAHLAQYHLQDIQDSIVHE